MGSRVDSSNYQLDVQKNNPAIKQMLYTKAFTIISTSKNYCLECRLS